MQQAICHLVVVLSFRPSTGEADDVISPRSRKPQTSTSGLFCPAESEATKPTQRGQASRIEPEIAVAIGPNTKPLPVSPPAEKPEYALLEPFPELPATHGRTVPLFPSPNGRLKLKPAPKDDPRPLSSWANAAALLKARLNTPINNATAPGASRASVARITIMSIPRGRPWTHNKSLVGEQRL